jgi:hypothetical protein
MHVGVTLPEDFDSIRSRFIQLDTRDQIAALVSASFNLTIEFRGLCDAPDDSVRALANGINELQHKLLSQALSKLSGVAGYPDDVLLDIVFEMATNSGVIDSAVYSLSNSMSKVEPRS